MKILYAEAILLSKEPVENLDELIQRKINNGENTLGMNFNSSYMLRKDNGEEIIFDWCDSATSFSNIDGILKCDITLSAFDREFLAESNNIIKTEDDLLHEILEEDWNFNRHEQEYIIPYYINNGIEIDIPSYFHQFFIYYEDNAGKIHSVSITENHDFVDADVVSLLTPSDYVTLYSLRRTEWKWLREQAKKRILDRKAFTKEELELLHSIVNGVVPHGLKIYDSMGNRLLPKPIIFDNEEQDELYCQIIDGIEQKGLAGYFMENPSHVQYMDDCLKLIQSKIIDRINKANPSYSSIQRANYCLGELNNFLYMLKLTDLQNVISETIKKL